MQAEPPAGEAVAARAGGEPPFANGVPAAGTGGALKGGVVAAISREVAASGGDAAVAGPAPAGDIAAAAGPGFGPGARLAPRVAAGWRDEAADEEERALRARGGPLAPRLDD